MFTLKVSEYQPQSASSVKRHRLSWHDFVETKAIPIATVGFLTAFAYASIMSFISVYAETKGVFEYVSLFFIVFAATMISVRPFTGRLYDRKGPNAVIYPSLIFFAAGLFLLSNMSLCDNIINSRGSHWNRIWLSFPLFSGIGDSIGTKTSKWSCDFHVLYII